MEREGETTKGSLSADLCPLHRTKQTLHIAESSHKFCKGHVKVFSWILLPKQFEIKYVQSSEKKEPTIFLKRLSVSCLSMYFIMTDVKTTFSLDR